MLIASQNFIPTDIPYRELEEYQKKAILYGGGEKITFKWKSREITRDWMGVVRIAHEYVY